MLLGEWSVRRVPALADLRADLLAALPASHAAVVRDAVTCATNCCPEDVSAGFMPLFLDPVLFLGMAFPVLQRRLLLGISPPTYDVPRGMRRCSTGKAVSQE